MPDTLQLELESRVRNENKSSPPKPRISMRHWLCIDSAFQNYPIGVTRAEVRIREAVLVGYQAFSRAVGEVEAPPQGHDMWTQRGWSPLSYQMGIFDAAAGESFFSAATTWTVGRVMARTHPKRSHNVDYFTYCWALYKDNQVPVCELSNYVWHLTLHHRARCAE